MRNDKNYLTIRKFSELTHTTIDTLKHYDDIGLLKPAYIGENKYRYYLPEQSLTLTSILFGKRAGIPLKKIRLFLADEKYTSPLQKYETIIKEIQEQEKESASMVNALNTLKYYYSLSKDYPPKTLFSLYLPECFILLSENTKLDTKYELSSTNIANNLFLEGFNEHKWPHYLLGSLFSEKNIKAKNFTEMKYFLKTDTPQIYNKANIRFVPNGEWLCMLFYSRGKKISENLAFFLDIVKKKEEYIAGDIFTMEIVNNLTTSNPANYCTMIYAFKRHQNYEQF